MSKGRNAKWRKKQQLVKMKKMTKKDEVKAIRKMKLLFRPMIKILSPALRRFFLRKLGGNWNGYDAQKLLYKLKDYNRKNVSKRSLRRNGKSVAAVNKIILNAITGRNKVCHSELPEIQANSTSFLTSWISVARLIGAKGVAEKLEQTRKFLSNTRKFPRITPEERRRSMVRIFRKLELQKKNMNWSKTKEMAANAIEEALFDAIAEDFAMPMRDFMTKLKLLGYNSIVDSYAQLKIAIAKCSPAHFVQPENGSSFDLGHLRIVMNSRHSAIHEQHLNTLRDWPKYFKSLIYVSLGIGALKSAHIISCLYENLLAAKKEAKRQIKRARLLPPILRNRQNKFLKEKSDKLNSRWLGGKSAGRKHLRKMLNSTANSLPGAS
ncbi:hypothetical protein DAPPUDRAFT_310046 [Daphnia pulex]|uniref:Uncharacterized protein n=1 Tax=Daphnia pulex TaxID=6669 RepID=E9FRI9_DAPPU|nr:hypothetical protein DAPPUDRAFT_310046 [Daphnia pulex]|eukprot:EFX90173.1 hypothetical protein DAPPUDRAFT_310046 [Daphnia pulex]